MSSDSQILRTGVLFKKGSGSGPFGRRNWKPRYFVLTPTRLQYFTFENGELKGELSLQGCDEGMLEVMPADSMKTGSSASTIWRVAINAPERRLLVAAGTEMEMNDWVDKLVMAFRLNAGQPLIRASLPAPSLSHSMVSGGCSTGIQDFQNFSIPRRGGNQRHSIGTDVRASVDEPQLQVERVAKQQVEETERLEEAHEHELELQRQQELELQRHQELELQRQEAEMRRQLAMQKEKQEAADELQRQKEQEQRMQQEREWQLQQEMDRPQLHEVQQGQEGANDVHMQPVQVEGRTHRPVTDERVQQDQRRSSQPSGDLLELQRRQKRQEHARERAARKKAVQQQQDEDLAFRLSQHFTSHLSEDATTDNVEKSGQNEDDTESAAVVAPHSSLVGNVKREMMQKQTQEHQRRREAILQQEHQMRHQEAARGKVEAHVAPREVEVAPREIEIVRRAPVKPSPAAPLESFEF